MHVTRVAPYRRLLLAAAIAASFPWLASTQTRSSIALDADDIAGVVTSAKGPEAGVWVIAETTDLPTTFARIVVTDDQGRYLLPDLPKANYHVWVRGYGLVDSARVPGTPGQRLNLSAVVAPTDRAAAEYYPPNYWLSLMKIPDGPRRQEMVSAAKCGLFCHQMGGKATREFPPELLALGPFKTSAETWLRRVRSGPSGAGMSNTYGRHGPQLYPAWTDRIAAGAVPAQPPRPRGVERNLVVSMWDWGAVNGYIHDAAPGDRRNPGVTADPLVYGAGQTHDMLYWADLAKHTEGAIKIPTRDPDVRVLPRDGQGTPTPADPLGKVRAASPYWGDENIWTVASEPRSAVMDHKGRVWVGIRIRRDEKQPAFCRSGATNKFAKYFPLDPRPRSNIGGKQAGFFDPKTRQWSLVDTCWWFDHNEFAEDADNTVYSGMDDVLGWINTRVYDETRDDQASQGWCPAVLDTNGDGTITEWTEPSEPVDPKKDHRISFSCYAVSSNRSDHSAWCNGTGRQIVRMERGPNPPQTCKAELYQVPENHPVTGSARGIEVDSQGIVWVNFNHSDYIGSFDRRKCKVLNGPTATGQHCPEGWTFHKTTIAPPFEGTDIGTDSTYLINVDRFNTLGLGNDVPVTYPNNSDALIALLRDRNEWVTLRVPYPMGAIFTKGVRGRIDNPATGWKGRGLIANTGNYALWHVEGGKGTRGKVLKFQVRPDPLAK